MRSKSKYTVLLSVVTFIGMTLVYAFLAAKSNSAPGTILGVTVGLILLVVGLSFARPGVRKTSKRPIIVVSDSATVFPDTVMDIIFSPNETISNPRLSMKSANSEVEVKEVWHNGIATLGDPKPIYYWHSGRTYPGIVNSRAAIIIRLFNQATKPAVVAAKLVGYQERRRATR